MHLLGPKMERGVVCLNLSLLFWPRNCMSKHSKTFNKPKESAPSVSDQTVLGNLFASAFNSPVKYL